MGQSSTEIKDKPIGIFDSGLGGLTVVKAIKSIMPHEDIVYFGDTGRAPYGSKDKSTIIEYAHQDIAFLKSMDVKIIIAACGTVSSYLGEIKNTQDVIGVIYPTCLAAVNATKNGKVGVMATNAAVSSKSYECCIEKLNTDVNVFQQGCPCLVPMIESGIITDSNAELCEATLNYVKPLIDNNIDTLVLGCTHYPIIKDVIKKVLNREITIIDSGEETAKYAEKVLVNRQCDSHRTALGNHKFFVSGDAESFSKTAKTFLGYDICENVGKIDIGSY